MGIGRVGDEATVVAVAEDKFRKVKASTYYRTKLDRVREGSRCVWKKAHKCTDDGSVVPPNAFDDAGTDNDSQSDKDTGQGQHDDGHAI